MEHENHKICIFQLIKEHRSEKVKQNYNAQNQMDCLLWSKSWCKEFKTSEDGKQK